MIPPPPERRSPHLLVWIAVVMVPVTDVGYVLIIRAQEPVPPERYRVVFVATYLPLMAAMLASSLLRRPLIVRWRPALRAAA